MSIQIFFHSRSVRSKFSWVLYIYMRNHHSFDNKRSRWLVFFCQKTTTLQDHKFKRKWRSDTKMLQQLNISYLGFLSQTHRTVREVKGPSLFLSFPPINEHSNNYSPFCIWDEIRLFLTAADVTARHLLSNIYQPLEISI